MNNYEEIQKSTLHEYMSLFEKPTIVNLANDSKIQKTRFFRLVNGVDMRLSEYLILKDRIRYLTRSEERLEELARECEALLSPLEVNEFTRSMGRKLRQKNLEKITVIKRLVA